MKRVEIIRGRSGDQGTPGRILLPYANWERCSLELPWRNNEPQHSCILDGIYRAELGPTGKWTPRNDQKLYHILGVPGRSLVKCHAATWAGDERLGWKAELLGCIAPGMRLGELRPEGYLNMQLAILESRKALTEFMELTNGEPLEVVIRWEAGAEPAVIA